MTSERWQEVKLWFARALDAEEPEREAILEQAQVRDPELARELRRLLEQHRDAASFLELPGEAVEKMRISLGATPAVRVGDVLSGRFEIKSLLGEGGMGQVFEAFDRELGVTLALKTLRVSDATESDRARLVREVLSARGITHPNVCRVFDYGRHVSESGAIPFFTMELLKGESLGERLDRCGSLPESEARELAEQMAAALDAAHAAGVVHRDFKPGNVLLVAEAAQSAPKTRAVVTDFGLARLRPVDLAGSHDTSKTGELMGTFPYMAPEVLAGGGATAAADVYSFGVVLYEMTTGTRPFAEANPFASAIRRATADVESPRVRNPELSKEWESAVLRCLSRDPAGRPGRASDAWGSAELPAPERARSKIPVVSRRIWIGSAIASAVVGGAAVLWRQSGTWNLPAGARVLLADIENGTGEADLDSLTELLRAQLAQSAFLNIVDRKRLREVLDRMARDPATKPSAVDLREAAVRDGIPVVVFATASKVGADYSLQVQVERMGRNTTPDARIPKSFPANGKRELFDMVRGAASWIRQIAGEAAAEVREHDRPPQDITTDSWDALRDFTRGETLVAAREHEKAVLFFESAAQADPEFTLAYARLGDVSINLRRHSEGLRYWQKAIQTLSRRRPSRREELRVRGLFAFDSGSIEEADKMFQTWSIEFPNDPIGLFYRTLPLLHSGRGEEAVAGLLRIKQMLPTAQWATTNLAVCYSVLGQPEKALNEVKSSAPTGSERDSLLRVWAAALFQLGRLDQARSVLEQGIAEGRLAAHYWLGILFAESGKLSLALAAIRRGLNQPRRTGDEGTRSDLGFAEGWLCLKGNQNGCELAVRDALALDGGPDKLITAATILARSGRIAESEQIRLKLRGAPKLPRYAHAELRIDGEILLARGDSASALSNLREAARLHPKLAYREYQARAEQRHGDPAEAERLWEFIAKTPALQWTSWPGIREAAVSYDALRRSPNKPEIAARKRLLDAWVPA